MKAASNQGGQESLVRGWQGWAEVGFQPPRCYPNTGGKCHPWMSSTCNVGQCVPASVVKPGAIPSSAVCLNCSHL